MASTYIVTYQDMVEHVLDMFDEERTGRPLRTARRAVRAALRELLMAKRWSYYEADRQFTSEAQQTTGTIEYDHTGGLVENLVTLTGATFPSNVVNFRIIIDDKHYPIAAYVDDTNVQLDPNDNPGADLSNYSYKIYREAYPLPVNFATFGNLYDITNNRLVPMLGSDNQIAVKELAYDTPDTPWHVSLKNAGEYLNSQSLVLVPPPSSVLHYRYTYQRDARQLQTELYDTGTVSVADGGTNVTVTTGSFTSAHVGCIIRFGDASNPPTSVFGGLDGTDNPFVDQATITHVATGGATCTIDTAVSQAYTTVNYTVSDPIDIEVNVALTALQRMAEAQYSTINKRAAQERREREQLAHTALVLAMERDARTVYSPKYAQYDPFNRVDVGTDSG